MLNHVMIGSDDIEQSKKFYNAVLAVLGAGEPMENVNNTGHTRLFYVHGGSTFSVSEPINDEPVTNSNGFTLGLACESPEQVKELHDVAIAMEVPVWKILLDAEKGQWVLCTFVIF